MYACTAADGKARCKNWAEDDGEFCSLHNQRATGGEAVATAPVPEEVLCNFNLNGFWKNRFLRAGVPMKKLDERTFEAKRATDNGVQVFGKQGLPKVSLLQLVKELAGCYTTVEIYIQPRQHQADALMVSFSNKGKTETKKQAVTLFMELLSARCWRYVHVWANPPRQEDGLVVHTVNSICWMDEEPERILWFNEGLWSEELCSEPEPKQKAS